VISRWVIEAALMGVVLVMLLGAYAGEVREKKMVGRMVGAAEEVGLRATWLEDHPDAREPVRRNAGS
jgi:hypothetical protein